MGLLRFVQYFQGGGARFRPKRIARLRMMRIGIIDIGSNTARLLVATVDGVGVERIDEQRAYLGLGAEIERTGRPARAKARRDGDAWPPSTPSGRHRTTSRCSTSS